MHCRRTANLASSVGKSLAARCTLYSQLNVAASRNTVELEDQPLPSEWYRTAYTKLTGLSLTLKDVEHIDGRLKNIGDGSIVTDERIISQMQWFNSLARAFIGSPSMQRALKKQPAEASEFIPASCFGKPSERSPMTLNSLTRVCNFLDISAQQRKSIRLKVCPQVTQHHIWQAALEEVLRNLKSDMDAAKSRSQACQMSEQIILNCIKLFSDTKYVPNSESSSWMRLAPLKRDDKPPLHTRKWEEVLEMFVDLAKSLGEDEKLARHVSKLDVMREGLNQIRDVWVERDISYKDAKWQDSLIQKKLSKNLGHSSKCLFTLLLYYLFGSVADIEVEICGGVYKTGGRFYVCIGKILTSCNEEMVRNGAKQLSRALGVFKFVWETAAMNGVLELQGHIWCMGAEERTFTYRGNVYFVHGIKPDRGGQ